MLTGDVVLDGAVAAEEAYVRDDGVAAGVEHHVRREVHRMEVAMRVLLDVAVQRRRVRPAENKKKSVGHELRHVRSQDESGLCASHCGVHVAGE